MLSFKMKGGRVAAAALVALGTISVAVPSAVAAEQTNEAVSAVSCLLYTSDAADE